MSENDVRTENPAGLLQGLCGTVIDSVTVSELSQRRNAPEQDARVASNSRKVLVMMHSVRYARAAPRGISAKQKTSSRDLPTIENPAETQGVQRLWVRLNSSELEPEAHRLNVKLVGLKRRIEPWTA